jgi:D-alanyl-D-alanine carboxypeptidase/D-alanyl-D-alanine-endopeptidase (penicillin-binding protein 4)
MIPKATLSFPLLATLLAACSASAPPARPEPNRSGLAAVVDSVVHGALRETHWGIEVWDQERNRTVFAHNAHLHFVPASNTKLVVTSVALGLLGPDWRYQTPVRVSGTPGDSAPRTLIIKGSGDPTMSARYFESRTAVLDAFADSLALKGIRRIGDVIIDATVFARGSIHGAWEIGDLPWYYATRTAAFAVAEAETRMVTTSGADSASLTVKLIDTTPFLPMRTRLSVDTAGADTNVEIDHHAWPDTLIVTGSMPPNSVDTSRIALPDPEAFAGRELVAALARKSIRVDGQVHVLRDSTDVAALPDAHTLFTWQSPPLIEIAAGILKPSQNWMAEQLLKTLGYVKGKGGSWRAGLAVERRYLIDVAGVDSMAFSLSDGSGLSAQNLVSPRAFVMLLEHARNSAWGAQYRSALPAPGMKGSTLARRLSGLESRLAAKTGSIANVNSLSGYLQAGDGRTLTFSIVTNATGRPASEVRAGMDALIRAIVRERNWE